MTSTRPILVVVMVIVIVVMASCTYLPGTSRAEPRDYRSMEPWESPNPDQKGISDAVIILSVVALVLMFIAWDQGWITPHF